METRRGDYTNVCFGSGSSRRRSSVLATFLLLPAMSLRVYVRAHTESISRTQTHTHIHTRRITVNAPAVDYCVFSLILNEETPYAATATAVRPGVPLVRYGLDCIPLC